MLEPIFLKADINVLRSSVKVGRAMSVPSQIYGANYHLLRKLKTKKRIAYIKFAGSFSPLLDRSDFAAHLASG
jgi:transcriptional regulator NrdR family protein